MIEIASFANEPAARSRHYAFSELFDIFKRRRRVMAVVFAAVIACTVLAALAIPKTYTTTVTMIAGAPAMPGANQNGVTSLPVLNALLTASMTQNTETYAALFQQLPVAQQASALLGGGIPPEKILNHVNVEPQANTSLLDLKVTWSNPADSARIANAFAEAVVDRQRTLVAAQADSALGFLKNELPKADAKVRDTSQTLATYEAQHHIADVATQTQNIIASGAALDAKIGETQLAARQAQAQLAAARAQMAATPAQIPGTRQFSQDPGTAALQTQLAQVQAQLRDDLQRFTSRHPAVVLLKSQERALQQQIAQQQGQQLVGTTMVPNPMYQQLQTQAAQQAAVVQSSQAGIAELQKQKDALAPRLRALPAETMRYGELNAAAQSARTVFEALQQKYNEATVAKSSALSDVTVTEAASAAHYEKRPHTLLVLVVGLLLAMCAAIVAALLRDLFDRRVKSIAEAERVLGLPVLASFPCIGGGETDASRRLAASAALRLASSMHFALSKPRTIAITSSDRGEGKSTVSLNLALAFAELGARVLLVDAVGDGVDEGNTPERGLYDALVDPSAVFSYVKQTRSPLVQVLLAGTSSGSAVRMLGGNAPAALFTRLRERYDYVVIDSPALNDGVETSLLVRGADRTLLVLRDGVSDLSAVARSLEDASSVGGDLFSGVIFNAVPFSMRDVFGGGRAATKAIDVSHDAQLSGRGTTALGSQ